MQFGTSAPMRISVGSNVRWTSIQPTAELAAAAEVNGTSGGAAAVPLLQLGNYVPPPSMTRFIVAAMVTAMAGLVLLMMRWRQTKVNQNLGT